MVVCRERFSSGLTKPASCTIAYVCVCIYAARRQHTPFAEICEGQSNCYSWMLNTVQCALGFKFDRLCTFYIYIRMYASLRPKAFRFLNATKRNQNQSTNTHTHTQYACSFTSHKWMDGNYSCKSWRRLNEFKISSTTVDISLAVFHGTVSPHECEIITQKSEICLSLDVDRKGTCFDCTCYSTYQMHFLAICNTREGGE